MPAVLNAANEMAVASFLDGGIGFDAISDTIRHCMEVLPAMPADSIEGVLEADRQSRETASRYIASLPSRN